MKILSLIALFLLTWQAQPDAIGYRVYRAVNVGESCAVWDVGVDVGNVLTYSVDAPNDTYFKIGAYKTDPQRIDVWSETIKPSHTNFGIKIE